MKRKPSSIPAGGATAAAPARRAARAAVAHPAPVSNVPPPAPPAPSPPWLRSQAGGVRIAVHVQPGARRSAVVGPHGDRLKIALNAPPVDGKANAALRALVAERLGVPLRDVDLVAGETSREKTLEVGGVTAATVAAGLTPDT
jgi:hypothetical protein